TASLILPDKFRLVTYATCPSRRRKGSLPATSLPHANTMLQQVLGKLGDAYFAEVEDGRRQERVRACLRRGQEVLQLARPSGRDDRQADTLFEKGYERRVVPLFCSVGPFACGQEVPRTAPAHVQGRVDEIEARACPPAVDQHLVAGRRLVAGLDVESDDHPLGAEGL